MRMVWPHKDVVVVSVMLEERLSPEEYRSIVDREFDSVASKLDPRDVFVYEVRFEFLVRTDDTHLGHQRVAEVFLRGFDSSSSGARPFAVPQVVLY
jgi:hypothetical protein